MASTAPLLGRPAPARVFGAHPFHTDGDLLALGFAPDGTLWSVEEPGVLRNWDVAGRRQIAMRSLDEVATLWAFSPGARFLAAASDEVVAWDVATGQHQADLPESAWVDAVAFAPDGSLLATGGEDSLIRLWDLSGQRLLQTLQGHRSAISALAFSGDGRFLASAGEGKTIRIWDVARGTEVGRLEGHHDRIPALAWHPDGKRLFSAGWDTSVRVWDVARGEPIILLNSHAAQVHALAVSPDGRLLASTDSANAVHLWDAELYRTLTVLREQSGEVRALAFSPDGQLLAFGGGDRVVHFWDARHGPDQAELIDPLQSRSGLAVSPDSRRLASLGAGTALRVWDLATAAPAVALEGAPVLRAFAAGPDGHWFAASRADTVGEPEWAGGPPIDRKSLGLWDPASGKLQATLEGQAAPITALAFSADGATLASGGFQSSDVWLWRVAAAKADLIIPNATAGCSVEALAFHPHSWLLAVAGIDWLATSGADGVVALWDLVERRLVTSFRGGARGLAFHPHGQFLAAATLGQAVRVFDFAQGRLVQELIGHLDAVTCLAYSPDGRWLATGGDDRCVRLWDARTGLQEGSQELDTQIKALAFTPDGRHVVTGNANTSCYLLAVERIVEGAGG
jgi:WD40 repeat protein